MTDEEQQAKDRLKKMLTNSTNMRMDELIGDLVRKIDDTNRPTPDNVNHMTELLEQLQLIDITLRGSKYDKKSGIVHRLEELETNQKELLKRIKNPDELQKYIDGIIDINLKQKADQQMKKWSWVLGTIATIIPIIEAVAIYIIRK